MKNINCVYCNLPEIRERQILDENNFAWVFPTNIPITRGHTLVAPKRCVSKLEDLTTEERIAIFSLAEKTMKALRLAYGAEGFNLAWNQEKLAGQAVPHFHLHIIPRKDGDTRLLGFDPRSMLYRTGDREPSPESEILKIRDEIKKFI
jgi:histidine triad (HIT) family protein